MLRILETSRGDVAWAIWKRAQRCWPDEGQITVDR